MVNYRKIEKLKHRQESLKNYPAVLRYLNQELEYEEAKKFNLDLFKLKEKWIIDYRIRHLQNSKLSFEIRSEKGGDRDEVEKLFQKYGILFASNSMNC